MSFASFRFPRLASYGVLALVAIAACQRSANANLYIDVRNDADNTHTITWTGAPGSQGTQSVVLDVYALVQGSSSDNTQNGFLSAALGFFNSSANLKADISFLSFNSQIALPPTSTSGNQWPLSSSVGGLGWGGTAAADATTSNWLFYTENNGGNRQFGGNTTDVPGYVEYPLGKLIITDTAYTMPNANQTSILGTNQRTSGVASQWQWTQNGSAINQKGNGAFVGGGAGNNNVLLTPFTFNFSAGTSVTTNPGVVSATLSASLTPTLAGNPVNLTGSVSNSGTPTANTLSWSQNAPASFTISPSSGSGLATGSPTPLTGTWTLPTAFMGSVTGPVITFSGTDTQNNLSSSPVSVTGFAIGKGSAATGDGLGVPGGTYGNLIRTQTTVSSLAGLVSTMGSTATSFGIGKSTASILAGSLATASTVTETWRSRASNELPAAVAAHAPGSSLPLYSDVVNLNFTGSTPANVANAYVLQMTYDPAELGGAASAANAASGGFLFLGYRSADGRWYNATNSTNADGSTPNGPNAVQNVQNSWANFSSTGGGSGLTLAQLMGTWGVDTSNNTVWAVIDHDAEFAAVPEPGTIALLVGGVAALGFAYRRRKVAKA